MGEVSIQADSRALKNQSAILKGLGSVGQAPVAKALGVHESNISVWKDKEIPRFAKLLALVGLKAVPVSHKCIDPKTMETLLYGHRMWINSIADHNDLLFEDPE